MRLILAGGAPKSRANVVHLETVGPLGLDDAPDQYTKNLRTSGAQTGPFTHKDTKSRLAHLNIMAPLELDGAPDQ